MFIDTKNMLTKTNMQRLDGKITVNLFSHCVVYWFFHSWFFRISKNIKWDVGRHWRTEIKRPVFVLSNQRQGKSWEKAIWLDQRKRTSSIKEIEALIENGVNINCTKNQQLTPLLLLMEVSNGKNNTIDLARLLIKNKADIKAKD